MEVELWKDVSPGWLVKNVPCWWQQLLGVFLFKGLKVKFGYISWNINIFISTYCHHPCSGTVLTQLLRKKHDPGKSSVQTWRHSPYWAIKHLERNWWETDLTVVGQKGIDGAITNQIFQVDHELQHVNYDWLNDESSEIMGSHSYQKQCILPLWDWQPALLNSIRVPSVHHRMIALWSKVVLPKSQRHAVDGESGQPSWKQNVSAGMFLLSRISWTIWLFWCCLVGIWNWEPARSKIQKVQVRTFNE